MGELDTYDRMEVVRGARMVLVGDTIVACCLIALKLCRCREREAVLFWQQVWFGDSFFWWAVDRILGLWLR